MLRERLPLELPKDEPERLPLEERPKEEPERLPLFDELPKLDFFPLLEPKLDFFPPLEPKPELFFPEDAPKPLAFRFAFMASLLLNPFMEPWRDESDFPEVAFLPARRLLVLPADLML